MQRKRRRQGKIHLLPIASFAFLACAALLLSAASKPPAFPSCSGGKALTDVLDCQQRALWEVLSNYQEAHKKPPPENLLKRLKDFQSDELRAFIAAKNERAERSDKRKKHEAKKLKKPARGGK